MPQRLAVDGGRVLAEHDVHRIAWNQVEKERNQQQRAEHRQRDRGALSHGFTSRAEARGFKKPCAEG